jgi:hypothetical protein
MNKPKITYNAVRAMAINKTAQEFGVTSMYVRQAFMSNYPIYYTAKGKKMVARVEVLINRITKAIS